MTILKICGEISPGKRHEFEQAVQTMLKSTLPAKQMPVGTLYQELGQHNRFCYLEEWSSRERLEAYLQTDSFKALLGAMLVLGEITEAKIIALGRTEELDLD